MAQRWSAAQRKFVDDGVRVVDPDGDHPELEGRTAPVDESTRESEQGGTEDKDPRDSTTKRAAAGTRKSTKQ